MRVLTGVATVAFLLTVCTSAGDAPSPTRFATSSATMIVVPYPTSTPRVFATDANAKPMAGGCGQTAVVDGGLSQSLIDATGNNAPKTPYAIAHPPTAAAFLFGYPLASGPLAQNKILWVVGTQRTGALVIDGHPLGAQAPTVHATLAPNSNPGEIYPSGIDVPTPGCWQFTLRWADQVAEIELGYR
jgi:hypothetical protein